MTDDLTFIMENSELLTPEQIKLLQLVGIQITNKEMKEDEKRNFTTISK